MNYMEYHIRFQEIILLVWLISLAHNIVKFSFLRDTVAESNVPITINVQDKVKSLKRVLKLL